MRGGGDAEGWELRPGPQDGAPLQRPGCSRRLGPQVSGVPAPSGPVELPAPPPRPARAALGGRGDGLRKQRFEPPGARLLQTQGSLNPQSYRGEGDCREPPRRTELGFQPRPPGSVIFRLRGR